MRPDIVVRNRDDKVVFTADAKWKTGTVRQSDIYQLTAYQLADDVPGALVYPGQEGGFETEYTVRGRYAMVVHELLTLAAVDGYGEFCSTLVDDVKSLLAELI